MYSLSRYSLSQPDVPSQNISMNGNGEWKSHPRDVQCNPVLNGDNNTVNAGLASEEHDLYFKISVIAIVIHIFRMISTAIVQMFYFSFEFIVKRHGHSKEMNEASETKKENCPAIELSFVNDSNQRLTSMSSTGKMVKCSKESYSQVTSSVSAFSNGNSHSHSHGHSNIIPSVVDTVKTNQTSSQCPYIVKFYEAYKDSDMNGKYHPPIE